MLYHSDVAHQLHFACHVSLTVGTGVLRDTLAQTLAGWLDEQCLFTYSPHNKHLGDYKKVCHSF